MIMLVHLHNAQAYSLNNYNCFVQNHDITRNSLHVEVKTLHLLLFGKLTTLHELHLVNQTANLSL